MKDLTKITVPSPIWQHTGTHCCLCMNHKTMEGHLILRITFIPPLSRKTIILSGRRRFRNASFTQKSHTLFRMTPFLWLGLLQRELAEATTQTTKGIKVSQNFTTEPAWQCQLS